MIPKAVIAGVATSRGIPGAIETVSIRHVGGGLSSLQFKSYERGREKWQGAALEVVYFDEEPDEGIYSEGLTRTNETGGIVYLCFTPLLGMSTVVQRFLSSSSAAHPDRAVVTATIDDAPHFSATDRVRIVASYMPHELEARTQGCSGSRLRPHLPGEGRDACDRAPRVSPALAAHRRHGFRLGSSVCGGRAGLGSRL